LPDVKISPAGIVIGLGVVLIAGTLGWLTFGPKPTPPPPPVLTPEARAYLPNLKLSGVHLQAAESYVQSRLVEVLGEITNAGNRNVKVIQVTCVFQDYSQGEIARERAFVLDGRGGPLEPGKTKTFRLAFDTVPESWSQVMPTLIIAQIQFE
jgi:hypothetical protein